MPWLLFLSLLALYALGYASPQDLQIALAALDGMTVWASNSQRLLCNLKRFGVVLLTLTRYVVLCLGKMVGSLFELLN